MSEVRASKYWAAAPRNEIGRELAARVDRYDNAWSSSLQRENISNAYHHFFGARFDAVGPSAAYVSRSGDQGESLELRTNYARSLASAKHQLIVGPRITWTCTAANTDVSAQAATILGSKVLELYWKERNVEQLAIQAAEYAVPFAEAFIYTPWCEALGQDVAAHGGQFIKSGDVAILAIPTWDVLRDPRAKSWEDLTSFFVRTWENRYDVAAQFPLLEAEILAASSTNLTVATPGQMGADLETELIAVYHWYHKRTPALPQGRETTFVGTIVLTDGVLSTKHLPLHRFAVADLLGTPWGYTSFSEITGPQEMLDSVTSSLATHVSTYAGGIISSEQGSDLPVDQISGGPKVIYRKPDSPAPVAIQFPAAPPEAFKFVAELKNSQKQILGLNDVSLGQPDSAMSGTAYALLASMAVQAASTTQSRYIAFVRSIGRSVLETLRTRLKVPQKIALAGIGSKSLVKQEQFSGQDLSPIDDVIVEIGNPVAQTAAGRLAMADTLAQHGMITRTEDYLMVMETGSIEPQTESLRNALLLIKSENEALGRGESVPVSIYDRPDLHVREHVALLSDWETRRNPEAVRAIQAHIEEHYQTWTTADPARLALAGIQPPPGPVAPPVGPPGAGGPPGGGAQAEMPPEPTAPDVPLPKNPLTGSPPQINGAGPLSQ